MYTIVMDKYKNLNTTIRTSLFQQESMVDKIQFLIPPEYNGINLTDFIVTLKYVDPNGNFHTETLTKDEDLYKNYTRYVLPITTKFTNVAGQMTIRLTLVNFTQSNWDTNIDKLETNSTTVTIRKPDGFTDYVNFEDIEAYKAQINSLNKEMSEMYENLPTDLEIGEHENLHLVHDGEKIGEGVEILMPTQLDNIDTHHDGIIDVDDVQPEPEPGNFIEL